MDYTCEVCGEISAFRCGKCRQVHYCSGACQRSDWALHRTLCSPTKYRLGDSTISGRGLFAVADVEPGAVLITDSTVANFSIPATLEEWQAVPESVRRAILPPSSVEEGASVIEKIARHCQVNVSYSAPSASQSYFPVIAKINHGCLPNAETLTSASGTRIVRAVVPIAAGEEILIDYSAAISLDFPRRQASILKAYGFQCRCGLCASGAGSFSNQAVDAYTECKRACMRGEPPGSLPETIAGMEKVLVYLLGEQATYDTNRFTNDMAWLRIWQQEEDYQSGIRVAERLKSAFDCLEFGPGRVLADAYLAEAARGRAASSDGT